MKINYICLFIFLCGFFSCSKNHLQPVEVEHVFGGGKELADSVSNVLKGSENGWEFIIQKNKLATKTKLVGYFNFKPDGSFGLSCDNSSLFSEYNMQNTFSLHYQNDRAKLILVPTEEKSESQYEQLLLKETWIDSEFTYLKSNEDTLEFIGDGVGNILKIFRSTKEVSENYINNVFHKSILAKEYILNSVKFFYNVDYKGMKMYFYIDEPEGKLVFHYFNNDQVIYHKTAFSVASAGLYLDSPLEIEGVKIERFSRPEGKNGEIHFEEGLLYSSSVPIYYQSAIDDFMSPNLNDTEYNIWKSDMGWSSRGNLDMFGMKSFYRIANIIFAYRNKGNYDYHRIGLAYFPGWYWWNGDYHVKSTVNNDILFFSKYGKRGDATSATAQFIQDSSLEKFTNENGHFVLRTIDNQIILVNAGNAESWIFFK